jgi:glycosyltransferase involved in cell wall biosynthesis
MHKQSQPLVSVIMPIHNAGKFLVPAIESIVKQTYPRIELLLVDDRSTDDSYAVMKAYRKQYPKLIRLLRTPTKTNSAGNGATNFALPHAKGEFIARMDADDVSLPRRIEKQVKYMTAHPGVVVCGTQALVIDGNGRTTGKKVMPTDSDDIYRQYGILHPIIHPSVMIRRSLLPNRDRIYAMKWDVNDDYYTFFTLLSAGKFVNLPETLLKYRVHGKNLSFIRPKEKFMNSVKIRFEALTKLNYAMTPGAFALMILQLLVVPLIPEKLIVPVYLLVRGMSRQNRQPADKKPSWRERIRFPRFRIGYT